MTPFGSVWSKVKDTADGHKDLGGQTRSSGDAVMDLLFGFPTRDYDPKAETRTINKGFKIERKEEQDNKRGAMRDATPEDKAKARGIFKERMDELKKEKDEKKGVPAKGVPR